MYCEGILGEKGGVPQFSMERGGKEKKGRFENERREKNQRCLEKKKNVVAHVRE